VSVRGSFDSYYQDQPSPFESNESASTEAGTPLLGTIDTSPDSARLVAIGSAEFLDDAVLEISRSISSDRYLNNLQLLQNAVDWAVEDEDLLTIRARGLYARLLEPMDQKQQSFWEGLNYAVALIGLVAIGVVWNLRRRSEEPMALTAADADTTWGGGDA
jgi:ABC-2 type transport system permease protein